MASWSGEQHGASMEGYRPAPQAASGVPRGTHTNHLWKYLVSCRVGLALCASCFVQRQHCSSHTFCMPVRPPCLKWTTVHWQLEGSVWDVWS